MKRACYLFVVAVLALGFAWPALAGQAQPASGTPVEPQFATSTAWLAEHLNDFALVILHVGEREDYEAGHIPGAQLVSLADISAPRDGLTLELPPIERLTSVFERLGIGDGARVVLYVGKAPWQQASRVFFTLDYLGLVGQTSLLDGGLAAWQSEGRPVTTEVRAVARRTLTPHVRPIVVDGPWVKANLGKSGIALIDARLSEYFTGVKPAGKPPRNGHIPGAINVPFSSVINEAGHFKDQPELGDLLRTAGVKAGDRVVIYCHLGQQATLLYVVARHLGYDAVLYDGSFEDWSARGWEVAPDKPPVP